MECLELILEIVRKWWDVRNVFHYAGIWSASDILREIAKEHIDWPQLCCPERCKVGCVGPEHKGRNDLLALASWIVRWCSLDLVMLIQEDVCVENVRVYALIVFTDGVLSKHLEW